MYSNSFLVCLMCIILLMFTRNAQSMQRFHDNLTSSASSSQHSTRPPYPRSFSSPALSLLQSGKQSQENLNAVRENVLSKFYELTDTKPEWNIFAKDAPAEFQSLYRAINDLVLRSENLNIRTLKSHLSAQKSEEVKATLMNISQLINWYKIIISKEENMKWIEICKEIHENQMKLIRQFQALLMRFCPYWKLVRPTKRMEHIKTEIEDLGKEEVLLRYNLQHKEMNYAELTWEKQKVVDEKFEKLLKEFINEIETHPGRNAAFRSYNKEPSRRLK